jgi:GNAT superfamily N-acetyltransferase
MMGSLRIQELHGREIEPWIDSIGSLRIRIFRKFPYLYDGTLMEEREYLRTYVEAQDSLAALVLNESGAAIGVTTCVPLANECPEFRDPFQRAGLDLAEVCYFGESLLLPEFRGRGLGKEFFVRRESHARQLGLKIAAFCAVDRPNDHPLQPLDYRPLDSFWVSQGFRKQPGLQARFMWKDVSEPDPTEKTLTFWTKSLHA